MKDEIMAKQTMLFNDPAGQGWVEDKLRAKFIIPPFSILDTRQGVWQERRRAWLALGMQSELGRGTELKETDEQSGLLFKWQGRLNEIMGDKKKPKKGLLLGAGVDSFDNYRQKEGKVSDSKMQGTSIFDPVLTELCYRWFCPNNGVILDPFAGGSVRGVVASVLGYKYIGLELRNEQVEENYRQFEDIKEKRRIDVLPTWIAGDSSKMEDFLDVKEFDFVFSCPPYYNLEVYSKMEGELSNFKTYDEFLEVYSGIISKAVSRLKENRFACFVVTELRDEKGFYQRFVSDTADCFERNNALFYNDIILVNSMGTLPVRINGQFNSYRKIGKCHQNVLVFYKGDAKKIKDIYKELIAEEAEFKENEVLPQEQKNADDVSVEDL